MISFAAYKVIHILGVLFVFASLGALILAPREGWNGRKLAGMTHGIALLVVLIAGFGAMARLGMPSPAHWPQWVWIKTLIWLVLGGIIVLIRRAPQFNTLLWWLLPLLGAMAAWAAIYKPT